MDGIPVHEIQLLLGHKDLRTTQRYIHDLGLLDTSPVYVVARLIAPNAAADAG
jgi:integrase